jgi:hypothetical protein
MLGGGGRTVGGLGRMLGGGGRMLGGGGRVGGGGGVLPGGRTLGLPAAGRGGIGRGTDTEVSSERGSRTRVISVSVSSDLGFVVKGPAPGA